MKVVITGATGAIGQAFLTRLLASADPRLRRMDVIALTGSTAGKQLIHERFPAVQAIQHTAWRGEELRKALADVDVLVHLAWSSVPGTASLDPDADLRENVLDLLPVMDLAAECGVARVLFVSSGGTVYGPMLQELPITEDHRLAPATAYGSSKLSFEHMLGGHAAMHGYKPVVLRPSNVYGMATFNSKPQGVVQHWMKAILEDRPIELWNEGATMRDFIHIDDMVEALILAMMYAGNRTVFNISTGVGTTLSELVSKLEEIAGRRIDIVHRNGPAGAVDRNVLSPAMARSELGFEAEVSLDEGLRRTWRILSEQLPEQG